MKGLPTSLVEDKHAYTRSRSPWILTEHQSVYGKLIHYISGGGMSAFGRTVQQEEDNIRQNRFLKVAVAFAVLWIVFYFV